MTAAGGAGTLYLLRDVHPHPEHIMGWQHEHHGADHEGWCVALTPCSDRAWYCDGCEYRGPYVEMLPSRVGQPTRPYGEGPIFRYTHVRVGRRHKGQPPGRFCTGTLTPDRSGSHREMHDENDSRPVAMMQAGCGCGWRSPSWPTAYFHEWRDVLGRYVSLCDVDVKRGHTANMTRAHWSPNVLTCSPENEERAHLEWKAHVEGLPAYEANVTRWEDEARANVRRWEQEERAQRTAARRPLPLVSK